MSQKDFVQNIVELCVNEPETVSVEQSTDRGAEVYTVTVSPNDVGRIIGKDGRVISSIRQVVGAAGAKAKVKAFVKVQTD